MRRLFIAAFVAGAAGGCFLKPAPAPAFRYACSSDADCLARNCKGQLIPLADAEGLIEGCDSEEVVVDGTLGVGYRQQCVAGLCEFPCDIFTFGEDCPPASGFSFCFNGVCANACGTDVLSKYGFDSTDDFCTPPHTCVPLAEGGIDPAQLAVLGLGGNSGGNNSSSTMLEGQGFCGLRCDAEGAPDCPPGQYCTGALCIPGCDKEEATPCADGTVCFAYGGLAACLTPCDPAADLPCADGQVCVPGANICQPSCLGEEGVDCSPGFSCDADLGVCIPDDVGTGSDTDTDTDTL